MRVQSVRLNNFRNISSLDLSELGQANVLVGRNAQGKTNVLEAIYAAASGGSFRTSRDNFLMKKGEDSTQAFIELMTDDEQEKYIQLFWAVQEGEFSRVTKLNAQEVSKNDLIKTFPAVIFSPEDIDLIRLSPAQRRRFMNLVIGRHDAEYRSDLLEYGKVLRQRNQLLLMVKQSRAGMDELDVWDEKISEVGTRIIQKRSEFIKDIAGQVGGYYKVFVTNGNGRGLEIKYSPNLSAGRAQEYLEQLKRYTALDIARVTTTHGIHRDDLMFILDGDDMRYMASRGEFRSAILALKFAEAKYLKGKMGEDPVYLLDDVFSELDEDRRKVLVDETKNYQTFITTNDTSVLKLFARPKVWQVEKGEVREYVSAV